MPETQITRCPHCQTTFRIRTEQLSAAKGAVRCGSCLQVFKASEHLVTSKTTAETAKVEPKPEPEITPVKESNNLISDDESSFDDIPDQIEDDPLEDFGIRQPEHNENESFTSSLQLDDSIFGVQEEHLYSSDADHKSVSDFEFTVEDTFSSFDSNDKHDESWASSLINDDSSSSFTANDESWADDLLDVDDDLVSEIDSNFSHRVAPEKDTFVPPLDGPQAEDQFHLGGDYDLEQEEVEFTVPGSVNNLHDEPLSLAKKSKRRPTQQSTYQFPWFWFSASVLMIFVMIAQVGYFKFNTWSRHPDYRPIYELICDAADCQLPAIQDVSKMNTQHFMVRPHPDVNQALYIDTLLINNAAYNQPFPDLQLIFTGLEDQIIASRSFKPKEYLAGELAGATVMPQKVPIHIAFEIVNPGAEAVSYRIKLATNH